MAYIVNKTDGNILSTVSDGQIDQLSSSLTLIGKNYSGFGEYLNENLVKLLENFSNNTRPSRSIRGQLWFDTGELRLKVYTGSDYKAVGSAALTSVQPVGLGSGDFWYNTSKDQLFFYDGTTPLLVSPAYSKTQLKSGFIIETVRDTLGSDQTVVLLYAGGNLLGVFSKARFKPVNPIIGYPADSFINIGFNSGKFPGLETDSAYDVKFDTTVSNSILLNGQPITSFVRTDTSAVTIIGSITTASDGGFTFGSLNQGSLKISALGELVLSNSARGQDINIQVNKNDVEYRTVIAISAATDVTNIYQNVPDSLLRIGGSVEITGNLSVLGDVLTVNTSVMTIEDKNIELARVPSPSDDIASGGGLILKGGTVGGGLKDHVLIWSQTNEAAAGTLPALKSQAWNSSDDFNIAANKAYYVNGAKVIDGSSLGVGITSAPGLTSFGTFSDFTVDDIFINDNEISTRFTNTDIVFNPSGTGTIRVSGTEIKDLKFVYNSFTQQVESPLLPNDAAPKGYVDFAVKKAPLAFSMDISDPSNPGSQLSNAAIAVFLAQVFPVVEHIAGTTLRVLCSYLTNSVETLSISTELNKQYRTVVTGVSPTTTGTALEDITISSITLPTSDLILTRTVKTYTLDSGVWTFQS